MTTDKLLPCPFCGVDALLENESFDPTEAWCSCPNKDCILWGEVHDPIKWNHRAPVHAPENDGEG